MQIRIISIIIMLISQLMSPSFCQATCSFISTEFPQFSIQELPIEPSKPNSLQICLPSGQTCCTPKLEVEFQRIVQMELERDIQTQISLIKSSFNQNAQKFAEHFKNAINETSNILRLLFKRTYGHFFVQNQMIFDEFFVDLNKMFASPNFCNANFSKTLEIFFYRIFIAEFSLLNPLRRISQEAEKCMLDYFPKIGPFGSIPGTISTLLERTFRLWTSFNCALHNAIEQLDQLGKLFSLPSNCSISLVQMRFCHLCSSESLLYRPCPHFCQNTFRKCLNGFNEFDHQWNRLITLFLQFLPQLQSVHNLHFALHPLPIQISEAIMHFQEKGQLLSSRILFRCFGEDFQKIVGERRKRKIDKEIQMENNSTGMDYSDGGEESGIQFHFLNIENIEEIKKWADQFKDELIRQNGFWHSLPGMFCKEGGIQSLPGEFCWNGTAIGRWKQSIDRNDGIKRNKNNTIRNNREYPTEEKYAHLGYSFGAIAEELANKNSLIYEEKGIPLDDEDSIEGSGDWESEYEYFGDEIGNPNFPIIYQRQWSKKNGRTEAGNENNGGRHSRNDAIIIIFFLVLIYYIFIHYFVQI